MGGNGSGRNTNDGGRRHISFSRRAVTMPFSAMHTSTGVESAAQDGSGVAAEVRQRGSTLVPTYPDPPEPELSRSLLNLAERDGRASYPQFTARRRVPT